MCRKLEVPVGSQDLEPTALVDLASKQLGSMNLMNASAVGLQGRILVFEAQGGKLITVCDREVKGAVYNVTSFRVSPCICLVAALVALSVQKLTQAAVASVKGASTLGVPVSSPRSQSYLAGWYSLPTCGCLYRPWLRCLATGCLHPVPLT